MNPFVEILHAVIYVAVIERPWDKNNLFDAQKKAYKIPILNNLLGFLVPFLWEQSIRQST
jgi:hypothetical protein